MAQRRPDGTVLIEGYPGDAHAGGWMIPKQDGGEINLVSGAVLAEWKKRAAKKQKKRKRGRR